MGNALNKNSKYEYFMQQIGKAAKILDLKGDFPRAIEVLRLIRTEDEI